MFRKHFVCLALALIMAWTYVVVIPAMALEVDCDDTYCFRSDDFSQSEPVMGICITKLPKADAGTVLLGTRVIRPGDILTAEQLSKLTFAPLLTQEDTVATVSYLPIYENRVSDETAMTISIRGKTDKAPVAEDSAMETYKNLPNTGKLKASDPEEKALTFTVTRQPKRGEVTVAADGSFTYTPKKNKVGVDSFTYTATDPAGNVSREATVTIQIVKPTDARQYTDTCGKSCRFAAEWMRNSGLFTGESVGGTDCFFPEKQVSRGEFMTMLVKSLQLPVDTQQVYASLPEDTPGWLKPYLAAAMRAGLTAGLPVSETGALDLNVPIKGEEVAVMLQNALDFQVPSAEETMTEEVPVWAQDAVSAMQAQGMAISVGEPLNRGQAAEILYKVYELSPTAPGTAILPIAEDIAR